MTPDQYVTVRYAGASGDFNPIHIDEEFARRSGCPGGSSTACGRWRRSPAPIPRPPAARSKLKRLSVQFRGMGELGEEIVVHGTVARGGRRRRDRRLRGGAVRQADHPQRRGGAHRSGSPAEHASYNQGRADRPPGARAAQGRRGVPRRRRARGLEGARRASVEWGPSTIRHELANLEELGLLAHPHTSAGRIPTEAGYRYFVDRLLPDEVGTSAAVAVARPPRARRGDAGDHGDALAGHQPAGDRHRAPDRDLDDPPRRGAGAPAAGADGGRDHLDGWRHQAPVHVRAAGRPRARGLGRELPQRAARRARPRRADAPPAAARSVAVEQRGGVPRGARARVHRARGRGPRTPSTSRAPRACSSGDALRRRLRAASADGHAGAARDAARRCCDRRSSERDVLVRIGAENDAPALRSLALVAASYGLPQRQPGRRVGDRAAADGLRPRDPFGPARRRHSSRRFIADVYDER